jgi:ribosomal-protein-alanine N-acetyltransferase
MNEQNSAFPELFTPRLKLCDIGLEHAERLHSVWTDPLVVEHLILEPFTELSQTQKMISVLQGLHICGEGVRWAVTMRSDGAVLGTCGFHNWKKEHKRAEMGYELDSRMWRRGFMSEAVSAALEYAFGPMELNRVEAMVTVGNERSRGFLEKAGFTLEGTLREYEWARGRYQDQWIFSLLKEERRSRM